MLYFCISKIFLLHTNGHKIRITKLLEKVLFVPVRDAKSVQFLKKRFTELMHLLWETCLIRLLHLGNCLSGFHFNVDLITWWENIGFEESFETWDTTKKVYYNVASSQNWIAFLCFFYQVLQQKFHPKYEGRKRICWFLSQLQRLEYRMNNHLGIWCINVFHVLKIGRTSLGRIVFQSVIFMQLETQSSKEV